METNLDLSLNWLDPRDERFDWLNVADWEARGDGWQPVRVPKVWRDKWPAKTARRGMAAAGMALRFRTDSKKLLLRVTFVDAPDSPPSTPAAGWERSRPNFFSLYRDGKYVASMAALTHFEQQDVTIFDDAEIAAEAEIQVLLPFYYRNAEIILHAVGVERGARLNKAAPRQGPRIFFHGDSITQGHGVTSPRETYVQQVADKLDCVGINYGFGGTAWADNIVAQTIAARTDWDVLVIMLGTNSFAGTDAQGKAETAAEYAAKYDAFLATIRAAAPNKPILCVTPILNRADLDRGGNRNGERPELYRDGIMRVVKQRQADDTNLRLADGLAMVNDSLFLLV
ncbi:MAG TPA: GDSL-type esterase/lipase family protein, partial [Burkholderiales bacterium]|nr:GDSL-type esterase/lipase family protein [Burkholderiales bacterium]